MNRRHRHALFDGRTALRIAEDGTTFSVVRKGETVIAASPLPGARRPARRTRTFTIPPHGAPLVRCA
jgi:hypothetical protein